MFQNKSTSLIASAIVVSILGLGAFVSARAADNQNRWVQIVNESPREIHYLFASNIDRTTWGRDKLGAGVLRSGEFTWVLIDDGDGYCRYDLKVVFDDGGEATFWDVNVCEVEQISI